MPNIKFNYLYRDSSNYKNFRSLIFSNPNNIPLETIEKTIKGNLIDGEYFVAESWDLPSLFFDIQNDDDHGWHEFESVQRVNENADLGPIEDILIRKIIVK